MDLNVTFDSSVSSAPAGFVTAVDYVVNLYDQVFTNNVTVNIDVGYGEIDGQALSSSDLGQSMFLFGPPVFYDQLKDQLVAMDTPGASSLPTSDPTGGMVLEMTSAEEKAIGYLPAGDPAIDGYVGFSSSYAFSYAANVTPAQGEYYFIGVVEHEISEVMGRASELKHTNEYSPMDLFRYSAPGQRQLTSGSPSYFSVNNGTTDLDNWNNFTTGNTGDLGDWAPSAGYDAYDDNSHSGVINTLSATDLTLMDALGWTPAVAPTLGSPATLWLSQSANNLVLQVLGASNPTLAQNWFSSERSLTLSDGSTISASALADIEGATAGYQNQNPSFNPQTASAMPNNATLIAELNADWSRAINGSFGNDTIDAGFGSDTITGAASDIASYAQSWTSVDFDFATGTATHGTATDILTSIADVVGSAYDDTFVGGAGSHTINGGGGVNTLDYAAASGAVVVNLASGTTTNGFGGTDSISDIQVVEGSAYNDLFTTGAGGETLVSGGGQDRFIDDAPSGADQITGFTADDQLLFAGVNPSSLLVTNFTFAQDLIVQDPSGVSHITMLQSGDVVANPALSWLDGTHWTFQGTGEFNSSGITDLLVRSGATGDTNIAFMSGTNVTSIVTLPWLNGVNWTLETTADFSGDGESDLLVQNQSSQQGYIALMNGSDVVGLQLLPWLEPSYWKLQATGDFTGDGTADMLVQNQSSLQSYVALMTNGNVTALQVLPWLDTVHWTFEGTGDINGDGITDLLVQNNATGDTNILIMDGTNVTQAIDLSWLNPAYWTLVGTGDFFGDGKTDLLVRSADGTQTEAVEMTGGSVDAAISLPWLNGTSWQYQSTADLSFVGAAVRAPGAGSTMVIDGVQPSAVTAANLADLVAAAGANSTVTGTGGNDALQGGGANDTLIGSGGSDTYFYNQGSGPQTIVNGLAGNTGPTGELAFGPGIANTQLWFQQVGNNLVAEIMGTQNSVTVQGWYAANTSQLQEIETSSGLMIDNALQNLVQAMATFQTNNPGFNPTAPANTEVRIIPPCRPPSPPIGIIRRAARKARIVASRSGFSRIYGYVRMPKLAQLFWTSWFGRSLNRAMRRLVAFWIRYMDYRLIEISHPDRVGHLCIEPDCYLKEMALFRKKPGRTFLLKPDGGFANDAVVSYLTTHLHIVRKRRLRRFLYDCFVAANAVVQTQSYASAMYQTARGFDIYRRWGRRAPLFLLTEKDRRFGEAQLRQMGLPDGAWFVCVHAREGGYSPIDEALHSFRNMDIEDYALAIQEVTTRGGWCIRMGDATMQPMRPRANAIDYARSEFKSARMDVFLAASCRFFLSCSSGLYSVAAIFGRPAAVINTVPLSAAFVYGLDDLAIPQRIRLANGRSPSFEEVLATDIANFRLTEEFENRGLTLVRASPEEIRELTIELMERLEGVVVYSREDEERQERFKALFREGHYSYNSGSRIGRDFLNRYFQPSQSISGAFARAEPG